MNQPIIKQEQKPLPIEIERKFLLNCELPKELLNNLPQKESISQGFLSTDIDKVVRIRHSTDWRFKQERAYLTVKGRSLNNGITRTEIETEITAESAKQLLSTFCGNTVEKIRYKINHAGFVWEIDEFLGLNAGLWVAEIELMNENQEFDKPSFIGEEVTHDKRYTNVALSQFPYSQWDK